MEHSLTMYSQQQLLPRDHFSGMYNKNGRSIIYFISLIFLFSFSLSLTHSLFSPPTPYSVASYVNFLAIDRNDEDDDMSTIYIFSPPGSIQESILSPLTVKHMGMLSPMDRCQQLLFSPPHYNRQLLLHNNSLWTPTPIDDTVFSV